MAFELARGMKIKVLNVVGYSNLIVQQVRNQCATKNDRMKKYRNAMWVSIEFFYAFSIKVVPRDENEHVDTTVTAIVILQPCDEMLKVACKWKLYPNLLSLINFDKWEGFNKDT